MNEQQERGTEVDTVRLAMERPESPIVVQVRAVCGHHVAGISASFELKTPSARAAVVRAVQGECASLKDFVNTDIAVRNVVMHPASRITEHGDIEQWVRVVLILDDGRQISCGSQGVIRSLALGTVLHGPMPWTGAVGKVRNVGEGPKVYYIIDWHVPAEDSQLKASEPSASGKRK